MFSIHFTLSHLACVKSAKNSSFRSVIVKRGATVSGGVFGNGWGNLRLFQWKRIQVAPTKGAQRYTLQSMRQSQTMINCPMSQQTFKGVKTVIFIWVCNQTSCCIWTQSISYVVLIYPIPQQYKYCINQGKLVLHSVPNTAKSCSLFWKTTPLRAMLPVDSGIVCTIQPHDLYLFQ